MSARFSVTYCSQCGGEFGPGDQGFSHCSDHVRSCEPVSEGTRTARLLLDNMPAMERPAFYIFPRSMEQAFGPGHRHLDVGPEPMHPSDKLVMRASGLGLVALVVMALAGGLK